MIIACVYNFFREKCELRMVRVPFLCPQDHKILDIPKSQKYLSLKHTKSYLSLLIYFEQIIKLPFLPLLELNTVHAVAHSLVFF